MRPRSYHRKINKPANLSITVNLHIEIQITMYSPDYNKQLYKLTLWVIRLMLCWFHAITNVIRK
jgi:hypothetical protein